MTNKKMHSEPSPILQNAEPSASAETNWTAWDSGRDRHNPAGMQQQALAAVCPAVPLPQAPRQNRVPVQSGLMPANFTTLAHFPVSSAMSLPKSAGEPESIV